MDKAYKIEISSKTIIFTVFLLLSLKFFWLIRDLLFSLFIAFIIMSALKPAVYFLERKKIPRIISAFIIYFLFILSVFYLIAWIFPPLMTEVGLLFKNLPLAIANIDPVLSQYLDLNSLSQYVPNLTNKFFSIIGNIFSNLIFIVSTIFFSFYFILEEGFIKKFLSKFFKEKDVDLIVNIFEKIEKRMSSWFWGELTLMIVVGAMTFVGLSLIGVKYVAPLALIAGLLEAVPNLGPTLSAVPAFLIAFPQSYFLGFSVIALYFIVQQLENNLIVPIIMKRAVGLNPIVTLIALIIGGKIGGVLGIILGIPTALFIEVLVVESLKIKREKSI